MPAHLPDAPNKLCVASTDPADELAASSNHGPVNVDLAAPGVSVLSAWPETSVFSDDFEHPLGRLWKTNDPGQAGAPRWGTSTLYSASPTQSITDSPGGTIFDPVPYAPDQDNWARTRNPIDLGGGHDCRVEASVYVDVQFNVDALSWEATRTPDEPSSWQRFANWTGTFTERIPADLPEGLAAGEPVYVRLRMRSDASVQDDGAYVDDFAVVCWGTYNASSYEVHSGTSVAAPHVAGAAALLFAEHPSATVAEVRDEILRSVDQLPSLAGKVASGGRLNLYKAAAESTVARSGSTLTFTAGPGEANDVFVTAFTSPTGVAKYRIADRYSTDPAVRQGGSRVVPGAGCTAAGESVAVCPAAGVARIIADRRRSRRPAPRPRARAARLAERGRRLGLAHRRRRGGPLRRRDRRRHDPGARPRRRRGLQLRREPRRLRSRPRRRLAGRPGDRRRGQLRARDRGLSAPPVRRRCAAARPARARRSPARAA